MIKEKREELILGLLCEQSVVSLKEIAGVCDDVSSVTLRRDLVRLEEEGKLTRTRGGAKRLKAEQKGADAPIVEGASPGDFDALILPPVKGAWAHTLRQQAIRKGALLVAESAPQLGGVYLGPRNFAEAKKLGVHAAREIRAAGDRAEVLLVALEGLQNTRERLNGFREGFVEEFGGGANFRTVNGRGLLKEVMRQVSDVFDAHAEINVVFGVNDHTILATLELAKRHDLSVSGYSVGGEGGNLFSELASGGSLRAVLALFPEVVGSVAIDSICTVFDGGSIGEEIVTPAQVITADNLDSFYRHEDGVWQIVPDVRQSLEAPFSYKGPGIEGRTIGFMLHYPSHEWYRGLAAAMRRRAAELGATLVTRNAEDEVAEEIRAIKRQIAAAAADLIRPGEALLLDGGECSLYFAEAIKEIGRDLKIYTNSLSVLECLADARNLTVYLTGGEYRASTRSLVGPSVGSLLSTIRVDHAVISPDGLSAGFGLSFDDERSALVCGRFCAAARKVLVLADHSVVGLEGSVQAARLTGEHTVITDVGTLSAHRLELSTTGSSVVVADEGGEMSDPEEIGTEQRVGN
ncbi:DeoR family transcriptional regulator [Oricola indica]|jgi:DeoR/GlpR family transcriptional regulator of sugar metabolism|uniref:DeoR family transcriptional regulator n=1 Tax=Oricola indica TaxID=2872591 RepID=UPI001CBEA2EC|nr:DeoR family transcriptional regulator [Oricola indica]